MVKESVKHLNPYIPEQTLDDLKAQYGLKRLIRLSANENAFGTSSEVAKALEKWHFADANLYPDSNAEKLRQSISVRFGIDATHLLFGNGLDEVIELLCRVILEPGDEVIEPDLTFSEYQLHSQIEGAKIKRVSLDDAGYLNLAAIKKQLTHQTKMIWLCNPNNPTGTFLGPKTIQSFLEDVPKDVTVIVDEAYIDFVDDRHASVIQLTKQFDNLVVLRTFSKAYGLANFRVGYAICNPPLMNYLQAARLPYNLSTFAEVAATAAFQDTEFVKRVVKTVVEERTKWQHFLTKQKLPFYESAANFIFFKVDNADGLHDYLLRNGYLVRNGLKAGWLRISIGKPEDNSAVQKLMADYLTTR
ncbi:histidinol-phosphate transaminase [Lentilactobacillus raoultii]|uniref:Histidinol-phosphate aminotransferase n=1 Tax=Lentilactobacillus raoultii TaxID=1987503 RepID=A0ABW3PFA0_9LACO|nr:histidinol-phosphate transaminase [Lentilactobacillus raoultii]